MTAGRDSPQAPEDGPYRDLESLVRATHSVLGQAAFRWLGNHTDAEDAVQMACVKMVRCWPTVGHLDSAAKQRAYLVRTVINEALQIRRQGHRQRELFTLEDVEPGWLPEFPGGSGYAARDHLRRVWQAIGELPRATREVVLLYVAGWEYHEVAEMLDIRVSTVRTHMSLARKRLPGADDSREEELA